MVGYFSYSELVIEPLVQSVDGTVPSRNNTVQFSISYYCTQDGPTTVEIDFTPAFYDTVRIKYRKMCKPWSRTAAGISVITISALALFGLLVTLFLCFTPTGVTLLDQYCFRRSVPIPDDAML